MNSAIITMLEANEVCNAIIHSRKQVIPGKDFKLATDMFRAVVNQE